MDQWRDLKAIMSAKVEQFYGGLDEAYRDANETFTQRLAKVDGLTFRSLLADAQKLLQENLRSRSEAASVLRVADRKERSGA